MNKIQRKLEYALMALKHMSENPGRLNSAKEIAEAQHIPFDVVARVLQVLAQADLLEVVHGVQGGYRLSRELDRLSLQELMDVVQGPVQIAKCMNGDDGCDIESRCQIISPLKTLNNKLNQFYRSLSVQEVLFPHV